MHATLLELFEAARPGLLWVTREGTIRYSNRDAQQRTGLMVGKKIYDPDLARTVESAIVSRQAQQVGAIAGRPQVPGEVSSSLQCRVIPGLSKDDALVFIEPAETTQDDTSFDNLMHVIRHDLSAPLKQARAALTASMADHEEEAQAVALTAPIDDLLKTLDKLVDLAQLWGSSALLASDRIEPRQLIQDVWSDLADAAAQRNIRVRLRSNVQSAEMATIYGSRVWLRRVFVECLDSALRHSRPGTTIEIEHVQMGPRVVIRFHDCGVFAPREGGTSELESGPSKSRDPTPLPARDLIGFKLCQHIVELHGGQLREESEDGERDFLVDLPTGAPHSADNLAMDAAQMQRYAQDLAQLIARSRTARTAAATP